MAAVPTTTPFTTTSGTASWNGSGNVGTITASNRAVLTWGTTAQGDATTITNFNIPASHTFNFDIDNGAVLNRVVGGSNVTNAAAIINGELNADGQVFILANGNISVGAGAEINATGGLVLSTLAENDFEFTANGRLALTGISQGSITIGTGASLVDVTGNLAAYAGTITANNLTVSGDFIVGNANTTLSLTGAGTPTTVGGNLTVTTNNAAIAQGTGELLVTSGHTSLSSGTGAITLATATNDFKSLTLNTTGTGGDVTIRDANVITLGASTLGGDLSVTADGTSGSNAISTNGTLTIGGAATFVASTNNSAVNIGNNSSVTGALAITTNNSNITFNGTGNLTTGVINSGTAHDFPDPDTTPNNQAAIAITTNGILTVGGAVSNGAGTIAANIGLTGASIVQTGAVSAGNGTVTLNATTGNITTGAITGTAVTINASAGSINPSGQSGVITATNASGTSSVRASGTINLTGTNAFAAGHVLQVPAGSTVAITNAPSIVLGTSNVTGNLTLSSTTGDITLGTGSGSAGQSITVGGTLMATVAGTANITDNNFSAFNVAGGLNLTTAGGDVILDAASFNGGLAPNVQFGQVKIAAGGGDVTISERTTLNLGDITAANLNATSVAGGIINSGNVTVPGTANFTTSGASTSVITNGTNSIGTVNFIGSGGALTVGSGGVTLGADTNVTAGDDVTLTSTNGGGIVLGGGTIGGSLIVNSAGTIATASTGTTTTTVGGDLSLTAGNTGVNSINDGTNGRLSVTGVTTIASSGNVTLDQGHEFTGGVVLNQAGNTGDVTIWDVTDLTISGVAGGAVNVMAGATAGSDTSNLVANPWALVLGNLSAGSLTAAATNGGAGNSGTLTQASGTGLHIEGRFRGVTNNANIVLANDGNSSGRVEFFTNGATNNGTGTISYREDGTIRVGNLASNSNITLRSNFGSIIEDTASAVGINARATLNATATNGSINIGGTTNGNTTTANVATFIASAPTGSVAVTSNSNIQLGSINANTLTVTATNNITQNAALGVYGAASFTSTATGDPRNITLTNNANNFGPVTLQLGNSTGAISIVEANTLNLRKVTMVGGGNSTFTANSVNGDIIDSGFAGVRLGGNATATGSGVVSLTAANGNITIINPSSDIATTAGVVFNAKDVTLSVLGNASTSLVLGAASVPSQATGNLSVTNLLGSIGNAGPMTVGGLAFFQTPSGNINVAQNGVGFGTLKFIGQQVQIAESGNMDIVTGSSAAGPAALLSGGSISIVNVGGGNVTFASTVNLTAAGNITPGNLLQAGGVLRVSHTGTADLGQLTIGGNLNGITPVDAGTGTYVPPLP